MPYCINTTGGEFTGFHIAARAVPSLMGTRCFGLEMRGMSFVRSPPAAELEGSDSTTQQCSTQKLRRFRAPAPPYSLLARFACGSNLDRVSIASSSSAAMS